MALALYKLFIQSNSSGVDSRLYQFLNLVDKFLYMLYIVRFV